MAKKTNKQLSKQDYEYMHSLSSAVLETTPVRLRIVLYFWAVALFVFFIWAYFAQIDEIARGSGEIIPSAQNQIVQNLEGGIVEEILVHEGQEVNKGDILLRIDNKKSTSSYGSNVVRVEAIEAKIARLKAEAKGVAFKVDPELKKKIPQIVENEQNLFETNKQQLSAKISALKERLAQKKHELSEARSQMRHLRSSLRMIQTEVRMTRPMVAKGVRSRIDFLKLQREANEVESQYDATRKSIPRLRSAIKEVQNSIEEARYTYRSDAEAKLSEAIAQLRALKENSTALKDQVSRTVVRSPMKGIVQTLYVHTVGGVIKPGEDLVEIVPSDQNLLVEVKIKPSDIAFIYYGQKAIVKFSAYDFSIYGGLEGKVVLISADTQKDEKGNVFYTVRIQTDKNYLTRGDEKLKIIPGMTVNVDIITGKKSVLDYILKPILKTKQYTFSER